MNAAQELHLNTLTVPADLRKLVDDARLEATKTLRSCRRRLRHAERVAEELGIEISA